MKTCKDCKYAEWKRSSNGRLHPDKSGSCNYPYAIPALPQSKYWIGGQPSPCGGQIERGKDLKDHCIYFQQKK